MFKTFNQWRTWFNFVVHQLRPISLEQIDICKKNPVCKYCPVRKACAIRAMFYMPEKDFEIYLQGAEVDLLDIIPKEFYEKHVEPHLFHRAQKIRDKRNKELQDHTEGYSAN